MVAQRGFGYPLLVWALEPPHRPQSSILELSQALQRVANSGQAPTIPSMDVDCRLCQQLFDHIAADVGEAKIAALEFEG